jgi:hypothetical protein
MLANHPSRREALFADETGTSAAFAKVWLHKTVLAVATLQITKRWMR